VTVFVTVFVTIALVAPTHALGDDLDIHAPPLDAGFTPSLMFIIDTSDSMRFEDHGYLTGWRPDRLYLLTLGPSVPATSGPTSASLRTEQDLYDASDPSAQPGKPAVFAGLEPVDALRAMRYRHQTYWITD